MAKEVTPACRQETPGGTVLVVDKRLSPESQRRDGIVRIDLWSPRRVMLVLLLIAVLALAGAGLMARNVTSQRPQEARLQEDGRVVTAAVVEVTNSGQYGVPREVQVRLPDGRLTEVDLTDRSSNAGVRTGSTLRILIDPQDPTTNRPVDAAPLGERWWPNAAPLLAIAAGALVLSLVMYRATRKRQARDQSLEAP